MGGRERQGPAGSPGEETGRHSVLWAEGIGKKEAANSAEGCREVENNENAPVKTALAIDTVATMKTTQGDESEMLFSGQYC